MKKLWTLASKEVLLAFRNVGMIVTMLVTPLVLTLAIGAAFSGGSAELADIPVLWLNLDEGVMAEMLLEVFDSPEVGELVALEIVEDETAARARVDANAVAALVIIPPDFSARAFPQGVAIQQQLGLDLTTLTDEKAMETLTPEQQQAIGMIFATTPQTTTEPAIIEIYASPDWRISTSVVRSIITQGIEIMNIQAKGITNVMTQMAMLQLAQSGEAPTTMLPGDMGAVAEPDIGALPVRVQTLSPTGRGFSWFDYTATGMAVLFLMFAVTSGGRTLLAEREWGTLPRLLVAPTPAITVLVGKMAGIVLTGMLQLLVLWGATSLVGAYWGDPLGVLLASLCLVLCASGVGALISAWSKSAGQAGALGTAITLVGAALSGTFFPRFNLPLWVQRLSLVLPQAWGIEIFSRLQLGRGLADILPWLGGVLLLTALYYGAALVGFRRQFE